MSLASLAYAQSADDAKTTQFADAEGWVYYAATQNNTVVGFLAAATQSVPASSFKYIWWGRTETGAYEMKGISATSINGAVCTMRAAFGSSLLFYQDDLRAAVESCETCGAVTATAGSATSMENGLAVDDVLQPFAAALGPDVMELVVESGAAGASGLSALAVTPSATGAAHTSAADDLLKWMTQVTESFIAGAQNTSDPFPPGPVALRSTCRESHVFSWNTATACAGGGCIYTGTDYKIKCCSTGGGPMTCTITTTGAVKTCAGACVTTPRVRPPC